MANQQTATLKQTLEAFLNSSEFAVAVIDSTVAGFSGSGMSVELFNDGTWRVLWKQAIGNRYEPTGRIMGVPGLSDEDYRDFCEVAGSSDKDALVHELRGTEFLDAIADEMREGF